MPKSLHHPPPLPVPHQYQAVPSFFFTLLPLILRTTRMLSGVFLSHGAVRASLLLLCSSPFRPFQSLHYFLFAGLQTVLPIHCRFRSTPIMRPYPFSTNLFLPNACSLRVHLSCDAVQPFQHVVSSPVPRHSLSVYHLVIFFTAHKHVDHSLGHELLSLRS